MDFRDRALLPRRGFFSEWRFTQNGGPWGGPADFTEWLWDVRGYAPVTPRQGISASGLYQYRGAGRMGQYDIFHVGGVNTLRGYPQNALQGRHECLLNLQYGFDLMPERLQTWRTWSVNYALQGVAGLDAASLWDGENPAPGAFQVGAYLGLHALVPGVDRLRLEIGTRTSRFELRAYLGMFDKTTVQRFRTR